MTVVYVDSVFVLNAAADYLLLLSTASLAGIPLRRGGYVLAALLGGGYAVAVFLPGMEFLETAPAKVAIGILLALIAYGGEEKLLRLTLLLAVVSCGFAGCVLGLGLLLGGIPVVHGIFYTDVNTSVLAAAFGAGYLMLHVVFHASAHHGVRGEYLPVRFCVQGRIGTLTALWDNGNTLRDPVSGQAVLVLAPGQLDALLPKPISSLVAAERLRHPADSLELLQRMAPELRPCLLPYQAVGTAGGLLLTVCADWAEIGGVRYEKLPLALSPTALGNGYGALWGGEHKKGGRHGTVGKPVAASVEMSGRCAGHHSLHRWK